MTALSRCVEWHHCHPTTATPYPTAIDFIKNSKIAICPFFKKKNTKITKMRTSRSIMLQCQPNHHQNDRRVALRRMTPLPPDHCHSPSPQVAENAQRIQEERLRLQDVFAQTRGELRGWRFLFCFNKRFMGKIACFLGLNWVFMGIFMAKIEVSGFFMIKIGCLWIFYS
jgi:hypothetical protein